MILTVTVNAAVDKTLTVANLQLGRRHRAQQGLVMPGGKGINVARALRRLGELGFLPGEPVQVLRRGPGGREPLAVLVGETMFALRLLEAQCIEVAAVEPAAPARAR